MEYITLIAPNGVEREFDKSHAERTLCIQFKHKTPKDKSWVLAEGYKMEKVEITPDCNCGVKITKLTITKTKTTKK